MLAFSIVNAGSSGPKVLILEFHGMKQGIIDESLEGLPHFQELIKGPDNAQAYVYLPRVFTTIPAASVPGMSSMFTGLYPQRTGVVSTIWFDRPTTRVRTMTSYFQQRINRILASNGVKTLFDYVGESGKNSMTTMLMVTKGADWPVKSGVSFWGNASLLGFLHNGRWFPDSPYVDQKTISAFLTGHVLSYHRSLAGILEHHHIIPDVMVVQLLGTDLFSHFPPRDLEKRNASIDEIQKHYAQTVLDPLIGRLIRFLKKAGFYEDCIFILVSEHGLTRIKKHIPDKTIDRSLSKYFNLPDMETSNRQAEAVIMPGACTKEIYLKNRQSGNWMDPPRLLADVKPAVDLVLANPDIQTSMNTLVIRQYPGERHDGVVENDQWWVFDWQTYQATAKDDLAFLHDLRPLKVLEKRFELGEYVVRGLRRQYTRETAPDIKVINKKGFYFERDFDKYGHHGSYYPNDCIVSFWVAGPGLARILPGRHFLDHAASTLDLVPIVTYLLGMPMPEGLDGNNPLRKLRSKLIGIRATAPADPDINVPH
jgi:arylsulfatase A-like enzyme